MFKESACFAVCLFPKGPVLCIAMCVRPIAVGDELEESHIDMVEVDVPSIHSGIYTIFSS